MIAELLHPRLLTRGLTLRNLQYDLCVRCYSKFQVRVVLNLAENSGFMWVAGQRPTSCSFEQSLIGDYICFHISRKQLTWCTEYAAQTYSRPCRPDYFAFIKRYVGGML